MKTFVINLKRIILWLVFLASLGYIAYEIHSFSEIWKEIRNISIWNLLIAFTFLLILMVFNWGIEAKKWQYLAKKIVPEYTFKLSLQTVLCGITLGLFTPNRVGEYGARVFYIQSEHKPNLLVLAFVDRLAQLWITIFFGIIFFFVYTMTFLPEYLYFMLFISIFLLFFHVILIVYRNKLFNTILKWRIFRKHFFVPIYFSLTDLRCVLGYASLRYCIFVVQYLIWGYYTDMFYDIEKGLICVNTMLFIKSIVPSAGLSELGIRESVLIYLYKSYGLSGVTAFHSALVVYAVNLLIPAVMGLFFVPRMEIWKNKTD